MIVVPCNWEVVVLQPSKGTKISIFIWRQTSSQPEITALLIFGGFYRKLFTLKLYSNSLNIFTWTWFPVSTFLTLSSSSSNSFGWTIAIFLEFKPSTNTGSFALLGVDKMRALSFWKDVYDWCYKRKHTDQNQKPDNLQSVAVDFLFCYWARPDTLDVPPDKSVWSNTSKILLK